MEIVTQTVASGNESAENHLHFKGSGESLFGIYLVNFLLCLITFNFYYPWARARKLKYIYSETSFFGSRFDFHGTGKEMFVGYIKAFLLIAIFYTGLLFFVLSFPPDPAPEVVLRNVLLFYAVLFLFLGILIPLAIHGAMRYRLAKTSWRGIRMGYKGERSELFLLFIRDLFLTIITLSFYRPWFEVNLRRYVISRIRLGNVQLDYNGSGSRLFIIYFKGFFLTILTLGIYLFWFLKELYDFHISNISVIQNGRKIPLRSTATASAIAELTIVNFLLATFTLGIATPWIVARQLRFFMHNALLEDGFEPDQVTQTEEEYNDALAEDLADMLDLGFI